MLQRAGVLVVVVMTALLAACSSGSGGEASGALQPPGTPLPAGFVVPEGSRLVGTVFPYPDDIQGIKAQALVVVDRDPVAVYDRFVAQGRRLGIPLFGSGAMIDESFGVCSLHRTDGQFPLLGWSTPPPSAAALRPRTEPPTTSSAPLTPRTTLDPATARLLLCSGRAMLPGGGSMSLDVSWGGVSRHALITVWRSPNVGAFIGPDAGVAKAPSPATLPPQSDPPAATEPGTEFGEENNAFESGYRRFELEPGSRVAADFSGFNVQFSAVLEIDGDAGKVMRGYAEQLFAGSGKAPDVRHAQTAQGEVLIVESGPFGGGGASLITDPTGHWLFLQASSD